jgi:hypothetical protein
MDYKEIYHGKICPLQILNATFIFYNVDMPFFCSYNFHRIDIGY